MTASTAPAKIKILRIPKIKDIHKKVLLRLQPLVMGRLTCEDSQATALRDFNALPSWMRLVSFGWRGRKKAGADLTSTEFASMIEAYKGKIAVY